MMRPVLHAVWFDITPSLFTAMQAAIADGAGANSTGWHTFGAYNLAQIPALVANATSSAS